LAAAAKPENVAKVGAVDRDKEADIAAGNRGG
jgi:hypothetical protein